MLAWAPCFTADGVAAGVLAAWPKSMPARPGEALRIDERMISSSAAAGWASLVIVRPGAHVPFDDPVVSGALRVVLARPPVTSVSTLLLGDSRFEGAVSFVAGPSPGALADDPFARVAPARLLRVGAGLFGAVPPPAGPCIQRYGSGRPWPWDRFASS
jgi:hypothetical protein